MYTGVKVSNQRAGDVMGATSREFASGQKVFGRYMLIKVLGRGGMGIVWLALDEELVRDVALKFLPDLMIHDRAVFDQLKRETKRCLELTHPHIVRIHDFINDERSGCISMEYIDGETLSNLRAEKERRVFEPDEIATWMRQLCDALDYAHNHAKVIHCDLKPANLMVNQRGDLKISDFGIARSLSDSVSRLTMEQGRCGTLVSMSPQQLRGERGTHLDDIYSLGASIYELITSKPIFSSVNIEQTTNPAPPAATIPEKSIAVLPFENRTEENFFFQAEDGIRDEILTRLSKIADLKVISRTSTQHYKSAPENLPEIARQLGVAHIVEGSVQKSGDSVRVNVQLIKAANDTHLWADTFDRKLTDIFSVESEVAKTIADQLRAHISGHEEQVITAKPTDNVEAYDAYLRGLAYSLKAGNLPANAIGAQKYLREAVRLDPKFALAWALLSIVDARGYITATLQPTVGLREEARQAAETALTLQPNLGEAILAKGYYHYACLKDYDTALRYFEQARPLLPNNSRIPESLAYVARRRGQWDRSDSYFNEAERLDPRNVSLLAQHAISYQCLRRFPEALRKLDQVLNIIPDDGDTLSAKAAIAQAEGDLPRASAILAPLRPGADLNQALETQVYQAILERRPAQI